jgi:hypothetical protein
MTNATQQKFLAHKNTKIPKLGDINDMEKVESFVKSHTYHQNYFPNKLFVFGVGLGKGSDDDRFYLGFTTVNILKHK